MKYSKGLLSILIIVIVIIVGLLIYQGFKKKEKTLSKEKIMEEKTLMSKKIVMVVASQDFRDEEYFVPKEIFEKAGIEIKTASDKLGIARGADGGEANIDLLLSELNPKDFDAIIFIGGPGALKYLDNEISYKIARETVLENRVLAAICISPAILAKAGILKGKKATIWSSPLDKSPIKILEENGAIYKDEAVVSDGKIITANGPASAKNFAQTIIETLK